MSAKTEVVKHSYAKTSPNVALYQGHVTPSWKAFGDGWRKLEAYVSSGENHKWLQLDISEGSRDETRNITRTVSMCLDDVAARHLYQFLHKEYGP